MFRKSVHLFSVALLGLTLIPNNVWADEVAEPTTANVSTELVESASNEEVPAEAEPETPASEEQTVGETTIEEPVTPEVVTPSQPTVPEESEVQTTLVTESVTATSSESEVVNSQQKAAESPVAPAKNTRASVPVLKDNHDGKIVDHEKTITDEKAKIPADYNFMPNFDHLDGVVVNSKGTYNETTNSFIFDLKVESANSITVTYKNVGTYNGKVVDMKVTVKDWTTFTGSLYNQLSIHKTNGITMRGISDVRLNYSFIDNLTSAALNVSGFFNFTDIDLLQSIDLYDHNNVQNYYVTKGNELYYKTHNGFVRIGDISKKGTVNSNMDHWLTYTYKDVSNFDVRYNQDYETGAVFNYSYQAPIVIEETPTVPETKEPEIKEPEVSEEVPEKETISVDEPKEIKEEAVMTNLVAKSETAKPVKVKIKEAEPMKQTVLPQTNDQSNSLFTILGTMCLFLLSTLFINKKKA